MPKYLGAMTIVLLVGMVLTRVFLLKGQGIKAMKFGNIDKTDFLIPPFALFYFYVLFAAAFDWPNVATRQLFQSGAVAWAGVVFCLAGLLLLLWSLISFRQSFRIGIDTDHPDQRRRRFRVQPQSDLCRVCLGANRRSSDIPKFDHLNLSRRSDMAVPPAGLARGRISEGALRPGLR
jgi:hypothetical protein